jgi:hypothetical protein
MLRSIENFGHKDLSPVERALAVARMIEQVQATEASSTRTVGPGSNCSSR